MPALPVVTAVVATRDRPEMLREALAAVQAQDYPGVVETIAVFDRSEPDESLTSHDPQRPVRVITNTRTPGLAGARNSGIAVATGAYIAFCDDDDLWLPTKISAQVQVAQTHPDSLVSCAIEVVYDGQVHPRRLGRSQVTHAELLRDRTTELHPSTFLLPREALLDAGDFGPVSEEIPHGFGEDYDLLLRATRQRPVAHVDEVLVTVRWGQQSYFFQRWTSMAQGLSWLLTQHPDFADDRRGHARVLGQIAFAQAAGGQRREGLRTALRTFGRFPLEPRALLAALVASRLVSPPRIMSTLHRFGRGI